MAKAIFIGENVISLVMVIFCRIGTKRSDIINVKKLMEGFHYDIEGIGD